MDDALKPTNGINRKQFREPISSPDIIRVYNSAPRTITLQLRREKDYTGINLTIEDAERLSSMLQDAILHSSF